MSYWDPTPEEKEAEEKKAAKVALIILAIVVGILILISGLDAIKDHKTFKQWITNSHENKVATQTKKV